MPADKDNPDAKVRPIRPGVATSKASSPSRLDQIKELLAEAEPIPGPPEYSLDDLNDENVAKKRGAFRHRFGPGFDWSLHRRESLMKLKAAKRMTDRETKATRLFGNLVTRNVGVELISSPAQAAMGVVALGYLALIGAVIAAWAISQGQLSAWQFLKVAFSLSSLMAYGYACYLAYLLPWRINRR
jgi:hypothetical protein